MLVVGAYFSEYCFTASRLLSTGFQLLALKWDSADRGRVTGRRSVLKESSRARFIYLAFAGEGVYVN